MPFIGNKPADSFTSFAKQDFTTSATTSYTLDYPVANANEIALFINFVRQEPTTAYSASGTSLTLTSATSASDDMYAVFLGKALQTVNPPAGSVGTSQLANGAVTAAKIDSGVALGKVLQVISAGYTTVSAFSGSTTTYRDSGLTASITPSSTSNKILITGHISGGFDNGDQGYGINYKLVRNSTDLGLGSQAGTTPGMGSITTGSNDDDYATAPFVYLDTPSSTSATTYKIQVLGRDGKAFVINAGGDYAEDGSTAARLSGTSYITLMEIEA